MKKPHLFQMFTALLTAVARVALPAVVAAWWWGGARADTGRLFRGDRMSSSLIECVAQDSYGFLWIGTEYGLNRFDGYRFATYFSEAGDTLTLGDSEVVCLHCDRKGRLWVGTNKGLARFDYALNKFRRYPFPGGVRPRVNDLEETSAGDLLIGTAGYGLYRIAHGSDAVQQEGAYRRRPADDYISLLFEDDRHHLWRSSHLNRLTRITAGGRNAVLREYESPCGSPMSYLKTDDGGFLVVCLSGILRYDYATETLAPADYDLSAAGAAPSFKCGLRNSRGDIIVATSGRGLMVIRKGERALRPLQVSTSQLDLASASVTTMMEDKDHNTWLGCYNKGLFRLNQDDDAFSSWSFSEQHYAVGSSVSSIAADPATGDLLCTVQNSGVFRFNREGRITAHPAAPEGTNALLRDNAGQWWLATAAALYAYQPATGEARRCAASDGWGITCMASDGNGTLYAGDFGKGMMVYHTATGTAEKIAMTHADGTGNTLCNDWIKCFCLDRYGMLWIGTTNGVSCMDTRTRSFKSFGPQVLLKGYQCTAICEQRQGHMVMGTTSGLFIYDRVKNSVSEFPGAAALRNKFISAIVADGEGDLWLSTSAGIWQYATAQGRFIPYINGNGLAVREYVQNAAVQTADGLIAFGTADGITAFRPETVKAGRREPGDVMLTAFTAGGRTEDFRQERFTLPYGDNSFSMEFSLLDYRHTESVAFEYRINGGSEWTPVGEGLNTLAFSRMKPGTYVFDVRAVENGQPSARAKTITVTIRNPWYATWPAYALYALLVAGLIAAGLYVVERRRRAEMEEQKMRFLINATHDIRSPLTLIMGPLKKLKQRVADVESLEDIETIDRNAQRLMLLVNQILDERKIDKHQMHLHCRETEMVGFVRAIYKIYEYNARQRNIKYTFDVVEGGEQATANGMAAPAGLAESATPATAADSNAQSPSTPNAQRTASIMAWIDRVNFDKVISNLLSNAFKYTFDGGEINVEVGATPTDVVIKVRDNGIGLNEDKPERLFDRFYQGSNSRDLHLDGTGIGLNLSKAIVNMHGGTISAQNREDGMRGTVLTVTLPKGNAHLKPEELETDDDRNAKTTAARKQASKNVHILIADDDAEIAAYIRNELGNWYRFDAAPNGREALKALLTGKYDLVISDVMMPEMDGITLLKNIKGNANISDVPVILLTSKAEVSDRLEGLRRGADAYLSKPFSMDELHILIDNLIDNVRRLRGKFSGAQQQEAAVEKVEVKGNNDALMERIMKCINENLSNPDFNVERLTDEVGISRAQLHRKMKEITGISAGDFIRNLRLEQAARLLKEGKVNITQVAYAVGFNNQTHFSTVFKKHYGLTPTEYAEQHRETPDA